MKKLMMILVMAAVALCGCGNTETKEVATTTYVETVNDEVDDFVDKTSAIIGDAYYAAAEEIFEDDLYDDIEDTYNEEGITVNGRFVSWEYFEEVAANSMMNMSE